VSERVVVIGGGFAGIAAACRLAGDGHRPILLERAPRLGGRAASFRDRISGEDVDYGHHVSMRCCTATHGFLQRIGAASAVRYQSELSVPILCGGDRADLRSTPLLPGALHLGPALLRYRCLAARDRVAVTRAAAGLLFSRRKSAPFGEWLRAHGQSARAIERLWDPICVATLNAHVDDVDLQAARKVFRDGFFSPDGAGLGLFTTPLTRIFDAARDYVESHNGEIHTSVAVRRICVDRGGVGAIDLDAGGTLETSAVVAAVPPWDLVSLVSESPLKATLEATAGLAWSPIVNVHVWFDRPIMEDDLLVAVDSPLQFLFNVSRLHFPNGSRTGEGRSPDRPSPKQLRPMDEAAHVVVSQSAADPWIDRPAAEIAAELIGALGELIPSVRAADVTRRLVIKHRRATFVPAPGADDHRPSARTLIDGLYLAGDWTAIGWPSTIEGAIRSGIAAAARAEPDG